MKGAPWSVSKDAPGVVQLLTMEYFARSLLQYQASDLHFRVGRPPMFRINTDLMMARMDALDEETLQKLLFPFMSAKQLETLERLRQVDFSFQVGGAGRFRCSCFFQKNTLAAAIRMIPLKVPEFDSLGLPAILKQLTDKLQGLILITGATGSGKSTTLAAVVQYLNQSHALHVLVIEDPIEFYHEDLKSTISQREIGSDALSMKDALIAGLRQDPDVIVLGEIRDAETIAAALTAAETGHLVLSTLHTNDAKHSIARILDVFRHDSAQQIRVQLAGSLTAVISQQLVQRADGHGLALACEVMVKSPAIEGYIRNNQLDQIQDAIHGSSDYYQMQSMNQSLERLTRAKVITQDEALLRSSNPEDLKLSFSGIDRDTDYYSVTAAGAEKRDKTRAE